MTGKIKNMRNLAIVNLAIWVITVIAMIILIEKGQNVKGLFPLLIAGMGVGVSILNLAPKSNNINKE